MNIRDGSMPLSDPTPGSFWKVNPKGNVPTLILDDGTILREGSSVLSYIADLAPGVVAPKQGTQERYEFLDAISFLATELHASHGGLFNSTAHAEVKAYYTAAREAKLELLEERLKGRTYLVGDAFTAADAYAYICLTWGGFLGLSLSKHAGVEAYFNHIKSLEKVQAAHARMATQPKSTL